MFQYKFTYPFEDNISIKGHMQGEALCSIGEGVFLDSVSSGVALLHSKKPSWESDVLQLYIMKEISQNNAKHPVFSDSSWRQKAGLYISTPHASINSPECVLLSWWWGGRAISGVVIGNRTLYLVSSRLPSAFHRTSSMGSTVYVMWYW